MKISSLLSIVGVCMLSVQQLKSQTLIRGSIKQPDGKAVQFASVFLLKHDDSSLIKGSVSDAAGKFFFENIRSGMYFSLQQHLQVENRYIQKPLMLVTMKRNDCGDSILKMRRCNCKM